MRRLLIGGTAVAGAMVLFSTTARAESFSADTSGRWARQVVGNDPDTAPFQSSAYYSPNVQYTDDAALSVSGGALVAPVPNRADDVAVASRFSAFRVATTDDDFYHGFPADNGSFYAGDLLGNLSGRTLTATFRLNTDRADGTPFTPADFYGDRYGDPGDRGTPEELKFAFLISRRNNGGDWGDTSFISQGAQVNGFTMSDGAWVTLEASLDDPSLWFRYSDGANGATVPAAFATTRADVTEVELMAGTGYGVDTGFAFAVGGPVGTIELDQITTVPEPGAAVVLPAAASAAIGASRRRRRRRRRGSSD